MLLTSLQSLETRCLSSLTKVFPDLDITDPPFTRASVLRNETFSFQVAYRAHQLVKEMEVSLESELVDSITIRKVGLVPSELPCYHNHDDFILRDKPGLYPDPLYPVENGEEIIAFPNQWRSLWITVVIPESCEPGIYPITVNIKDKSGTLLGSETLELEVIPHILPDQKLLHTEWFYTDCIATWYGVEAFSEKHWDLIDTYMKNAAKHGINMILTPIFTPPLDTKVGHERPTMQLVDIKKDGNTYSFDFSKLDKWIKLCETHGIRYLEMAHLFTQWGAQHAPKIMVWENGSLIHKFGWHTESTGEENAEFLKQFLPALTDHLDRNHMQGRVYFHISDEPAPDVMEHYVKLSKMVKSLIRCYRLMDAISHQEIYEASAMTDPVVANDAIDTFIQNNIPDLWTYYCCVQGENNVSNRFFNMPSVRNRIIGIQLYKFGLRGFLHWGYNYWYSGLSVRRINPFTNTDGGYFFPSGDAFLVYPGDNGPIDSIRSEVFFEALQDLRALDLLEHRIGKEKVIKILEEDCGPITFRNYPKDLNWLLKTRDKINRMIRDI